MIHQKMYLPDILVMTQDIGSGNWICNYISALEAAWLFTACKLRIRR
jgi:hypothetical protein